MDAWAWLHAGEETASPALDLSQARVTAVLVALDGQRWLPETLAGLAASRRRPDRLIAIDNDSSDETSVLLLGALHQGTLDAVYRREVGEKGRGVGEKGRRASGFGVAVQSALAQDVAARGAIGPESIQADSLHAGSDAPAAGQQPAESGWLWLLHDDAVPAPDALDQLLAHVTTDPTIDITGPKLLVPKRRHSAQRLSEIGVTISGTGRREVPLDRGEIDQGQRDEPREQLGVSTCGMLVRTSVWTELRGLDVALPVFRDGVDFGWRARLAGYRVVTTPSAVLTHRQVSRAGLRPRGAAGPRPGQTDRQLGLLVVAGHARGVALPLVWFHLVWSCLLRAVGYLFGKAPGRSLDELLAVSWLVTHPGEVHRFRRRVAALRSTPSARQAVRALRPPWWSSLRLAAEAVSVAISDRYQSVAGEVEVPSIDELTGDDFSTTGERSTSPWFSPVVLSLMLTVVGSLVAARDLFGSGSLVAPALLPAQSDLRSLWQAVRDPVVGAPTQSTPPWMALVAVGSTASAGRPEWFVTALLCAVVPLSLLTSYPVVRRLIAGRRVRLWAAATYALLPILLGGTNQGRLSMSVFAIALPLLVLAARALVLRRPRRPEAWRGGWGAGLVLTVLVAFEPSLILLALLAGLIGAVGLRRSPRKAGRIAIGLGVPLLLLAPWWPSVLSTWGRLFTGPDSALQGAPTAPAVWGLLVGRDVGPGLPPLWLGGTAFGVIWLVALVGLARRPGSRVVVAAWVTAVLSLGCAVLLSRMVVSVPPVSVEVRPWVGPYLLLAFGALVLAGGVGVDGLLRDLRNRSFTWLQPGVLLAGALIGLVTVLSAGWWVWAGASDPIARERLDTMPPYVLNALRSDRGVRLLAVDLGGDQARFSVVADDQVRLGDADRGYTFGGGGSATAETQAVLARMLAGTSDSDISPELSALGIGLVWVTGADQDEVARIDNTPGLGTASGNLQGTVWQLEPAVSRASLITGTTTTPLGRPPVSIAQAETGRQLRLGEAADRRWRATLDGAPLDGGSQGWQQVFDVPAAGGTLAYSLHSGAHWFLLAQGALLVVVAVLTAPGIRRPELRDPARSARRAATVGGGSQ